MKEGQFINYIINMTINHIHMAESSTFRYTKLNTSISNFLNHCLHLLNPMLRDFFSSSGFVEISPSAAPLQAPLPVLVDFPTSR